MNTAYIHEGQQANSLNNSCLNSLQSLDPIKYKWLYPISTYVLYIMLLTAISLNYSWSFLNIRVPAYYVLCLIWYSALVVLLYCLLYTSVIRGHWANLLYVNKPVTYMSLIFFYGPHITCICWVWNEVYLSIYLSIYLSACLSAYLAKTNRLQLLFAFHPWCS